MSYIVGNELKRINISKVISNFISNSHFYTQNYANKNVGNYKDNSVRFNAAIKLSGQFVAYQGMIRSLFEELFSSNMHIGNRFSIVDAPTTETMVIGGQSVTVPLAGVMLGGLSNQAAAIAQIDSVNMPVVKRNNFNDNNYFSPVPQLPRREP